VTVTFEVDIFEEGGVFVAHAPQLDVSSCGDTEEEARENITEAVRAYLEALERLGALEKVLAFIPGAAEEN